MRRLALAAIPLAIFALALEAGLRIAPQAIPLDVLIRYEPTLRSEIAARRKLQRRADTEPIPRDDGGPADRLWKFKGDIDVTQHFDEEGIVETVHMDAMGFCNPVRSAYDAPRFDVIAIGDSFTWCTSVDPADAWPARLEKLTGLHTYNLGLPGRGLHEYVQTLKAYGLVKQPRIVVMNIYEGNDFRDAYYFWQAQQDPARQLERDPCPYPWPALCRAQEALEHGFLGRHSYAANLVAGTAWHLAVSAEKREIEFRYTVRFPEGRELEFNTNNADRDEVMFARRLREGQLGPELMDDGLTAFLALSRQHGFVPVVVYTPSAYTAYAELSHFDDPGLEADLRAYSRTLRDHFAGHAAKQGFPYVDLTPVLQAEARRVGPQRLLYYRSNVHLTRWGHDVVAQQVAALLSRLRSSPQAGR